MMMMMMMMSDYFVYGGITFFTIAIQMLLTGVQAYLFMQHCELFVTHFSLTS
jgi:hypothetical protein